MPDPRRDRRGSDLKYFIKKNGTSTDENEQLIEQLKREAYRHSERDSERPPNSLPKENDAASTHLIRESHDDTLKGLYRELERLPREGGRKTYRRRRLSKKKRSRRCTKSKAHKSKSKARKL
jgi:hypothetical protein